MMSRPRAMMKVRTKAGMLVMRPAYPHHGVKTKAERYYNWPRDDDGMALEFAFSEDGKPLAPAIDLEVPMDAYHAKLVRQGALEHVKKPMKRARSDS